jgi:hypothetical protein
MSAVISGAVKFNESFEWWGSDGRRALIRKNSMSLIFRNSSFCFTDKQTKSKTKSFYKTVTNPLKESNK